MQFHLDAGVASLRPVHIAAPADWMGALDGVLDDAAAHVLLLDLSAVESAAPGWDDTACRAWRLWRKPTVCALAGEAAGDLLAFALACDVRTCSPGTTLAFSPGHCTLLLESLIGSEAAAALRAGGRMDASEARRAGIVFAIAADPAADAARLARVIASRGPLAVQLAKEAIWRGLEMPLEHALRFETDLTLLLQTTKDRAEGVSAFLEKREPHFTGS
jgi:enoyl-CoA hydratase/carnithine racemase